MAENLTPLEQNTQTLAEIKTMVENLPEAGGGTDISLGITSAAVGDIVKVKAVDADGKPTEWEAAETKAVLLADSGSLTEAVQYCDFDVEDYAEYIVLIGVSNNDAGNPGNRQLAVMFNPPVTHYFVLSPNQVLASSGMRSCIFRITHVGETLQSFACSSLNEMGVVAPPWYTGTQFLATAVPYPSAGVSRIRITSNGTLAEYKIGQNSQIKIYGVNKT